MMNFRRGRRPEEPEINLIPFIDVLLVVLIFLMVSTTYSKFTELQITLPTAEAEKQQQKPFEINVTIDAKGKKCPMPVLLTSGYAEELAGDQAKPDADLKILRKPYRMADLAAAIDGALKG